MAAMLVALQSALLIFSLRVVDISLYTMRIMMVMRGQKKLAWIFAFCQASVYVFALRIVFSDLGNYVKIFGYATGFATGMVVGMTIENRLGIGFSHLRIISSKRGEELTEKLRDAGFAVTEVPGRGLDGTVNILVLSVHRREVRQVMHMVEQIDDEAFVTSEQIEPVRQGYWKRNKDGKARSSKSG